MGGVSGSAGAALRGEGEGRSRLTKEQGPRLSFGSVSR